MPLIILSLVVQVALVVHVFRTGRQLTWAFIIMFAPLVGAIAYILVELLPEWTASRSGQKLRGAIDLAANPDRDLKAAARKLAVADTVQNAVQLANECLEKGRWDEARDLFERSLRGVHEEDPDLRLGLAKAQFGLGDWAATIATLERLRQHNPQYDSAAGHLLYARAKEALGELDAATEEYEALARYYPGPEPKGRLALLLQSRGESARAQALWREILAQSEAGGRLFRERHREWVERAKRELG